MDQHPIPRQITTFEFKLIGFLTLKQFIYLVVFLPLAYIVFVIFPIPVVNFLLALIVGLTGVALALIPINDRPLDVWLKNLLKRLTSPTQYIYHKNNPAIYFLKDLFFLNDPHRVLTHIDSQEKLAAYLAKNKKTIQANTNKQAVNTLLQNPQLSVVSKTQVALKSQPSSPGVKSGPKIPFFTGVVKNHKLITLPGILIYVKDEKGNILRLLKTNPHGVFATFNSLPVNEYFFEIKDPKNVYFFDTMKIKVEETNIKPLEIFSKELL